MEGSSRRSLPAWAKVPGVLKKGIGGPWVKYSEHQRIVALLEADHEAALAKAREELREKAAECRDLAVRCETVEAGSKLLGAATAYDDAADGLSVADREAGVPEGLPITPGGRP